MSVFIIFGVSGSGKSTVGKLLANKLGVNHYDGDNFHPQGNIDKMHGGTPLDDCDRLPWLHNLASELKVWCKEGVVLSCSALKEDYRQILVASCPEIQWIYLEGNRDLIHERLQQRKAHFFDIGLLDSQFSDLEIPNYAFRVSIEHSPEEIINIITSKTLHG